MKDLVKTTFYVICIAAIVQVVFKQDPIALVQTKYAEIEQWSQPVQPTSQQNQ